MFLNTQPRVDKNVKVISNIFDYNKIDVYCKPLTCDTSMCANICRPIVQKSMNMYKCYPRVKHISDSRRDLGWG